MAIQLAEIYVRYRYGERIAEEEKPYLITELPDSWVVEGAKLPYEVAGGVFIIEINKKNGCVLKNSYIVNNAGADGCGWKHCVERGI